MDNQTSGQPDKWRNKKTDNKFVRHSSIRGLNQLDLGFICIYMQQKLPSTESAKNYVYIDKCERSWFLRRP